MRDYEELVRQLRKEADKWCTNCCYRAEVFTCVAPDDRKKDCDVYTKLQAADAIEELSLVCRTQKAAFDAYIGKTPKWISVEERLPEEAGEYIVAYHPCYWDSVNTKCTKVGIDNFRGKTTWAKKKFQRVTHWMPLPEPPKEDGQ